MNVIFATDVHYHGGIAKAGEIVDVPENIVYRLVMSVDREYMMQRGMDTSEIDSMIFQYFERR